MGGGGETQPGQDQHHCRACRCRRCWSIRSNPLGQTQGRGQDGKGVGGHHERLRIRVTTGTAEASGEVIARRLFPDRNGNTDRPKMEECLRRLSGPHPEGPSGRSSHMDHQLLELTRTSSAGTSKLCPKCASKRVPDRYRVMRFPSCICLEIG